MKLSEFCLTGAPLILAFLGWGCVASPRFTGTARPVETSSVEEGMASYYAEDFHQRQTSSGETYDMNSFTAAHRTLPFGTRVRVTNLDNGRAVEVRINDRGPFKDDRIIDLSFAAAKAIEMIGTGTAKVRIEVIDRYSGESDQRH